MKKVDDFYCFLCLFSVWWKQFTKTNHNKSSRLVSYCFVFDYGNLKLNLYFQTFNLKWFEKRVSAILCKKLKRCRWSIKRKKHYSFQMLKQHQKTINTCNRMEVIWPTLKKCTWKKLIIKLKCAIYANIEKQCILFVNQFRTCLSQN